jgi:catechol 2,3-dioxygenase-like lactoylglutathione lyase family enzyme
MKTRVLTRWVEETRDWYCDLLGLAVLEEWQDLGDSGCILGLHNTPGEALLEIHRRSDVRSPGGLSLHFRVDDIQTFAVPAGERFRSRGPVGRPWGSRYLFFADPNGNTIVVFSGSSL